MASGPVETKTAASSATGIVTGLLAWGLVYFIPAWHSGIPGPLVPFIPVAAGWLVATATGYLAPHTHRPDLTAPVANLTPQQIADIGQALAQLAPPPPRRGRRTAKEGTTP